MSEKGNRRHVSILFYSLLLITWHKDQCHWLFNLTSQRRNDSPTRRRWKLVGLNIGLSQTLRSARVESAERTHQTAAATHVCSRLRVGDSWKVVQSPRGLTLTTAVEWR